MSEVPELRGAAEQNLSGRGGSEVYRVQRASRVRVGFFRRGGLMVMRHGSHVRRCYALHRPDMNV